jgi:hypothetical protein
MNDPHVYDKLKYHTETTEAAGLPEENAGNHIVPILRWLIENSLMNDFFYEQSTESIKHWKEGHISIHQLFGNWDSCLISDMISDKGNLFALDYFDYEKGRYIHDYKDTLQGELPSEFHIQYSEDSYAKIKVVIDQRYRAFQERKSKPWWKFWA